MSSLVRYWMEGLDGKITARPPHQNPIMVGMSGMDQVNASGSEKTSLPQPFNADILDEMAELRRKLTGLPQGEESTDEERGKIESKLRELQDKLNESPQDADATYGLRKVPVTDKPEEADLKPSEVKP